LPANTGHHGGKRPVIDSNCGASTRATGGALGDCYTRLMCTRTNCAAPTKSGISSAGRGKHYSAASPTCADKPYGFASFLRAARFDNSFSSVRMFSECTSHTGTFEYTGASQLGLAAVGLQSQDNALFTATYPWLGFRIGVIGDLTVGRS
jgi:hypothetical protein